VSIKIFLLLAMRLALDNIVSSVLLLVVKQVFMIFTLF